MKKIIKFSKKNNDVSYIKENLINENLINLRRSIKINKHFNKLKKRKKCIICNNKILKKDFISHNVSYIICKNCGHLNGDRVLNNKFNQNIYVSNKGKNYSYLYDRLFSLRLKNIYYPKVKFLKKTIKKKIKILDFGCGSGHFVKACEDHGIQATGVDPNYELIKFGRKNLKKNELNHLSFEGCIQKIESTEADLVSLIFVLEHLENPNLIFKSFVKSKAKYLFIAVPLLSLSVFIENVFQNVYPRQLGGPHTNLFSNESLKYISKKYKLKTLGEWWFGSDFSDLYRSLILTSNYKNNIYKKKLDNILFKNLNEFQKILDKSKSSSEVHMIFKK